MIKKFCLYLHYKQWMWMDWFAEKEYDCHLIWCECNKLSSNSIISLQTLVIAPLYYIQPIIYSPMSSAQPQQHDAPIHSFIMASQWTTLPSILCAPGWAGRRDTSCVYQVTARSAPGSVCKQLEPWQVSSDPCIHVQSGFLHCDTAGLECVDGSSFMI